jgi:hypothetical protein
MATNMVVVRYRTKPDRSEENQRLVQAVFAELADTRPEGLRYTTLRLADGTFLHIAEVDAEANSLNEVAAFAAFLENIAERCEPGEGPNPQPATVVGVYGPSVWT